MNYIINPAMDPGVSLGDLLTLTDKELDDLQSNFLETEIQSDMSVDVHYGQFLFPDGGSRSFRNFKGYVSSSYIDVESGDRWFIMYDGGALNVTAMFRLLREAVNDARAR